MKENKVIICVTILITMILCVSNVFASEQNYNVISWCADDMEIGNTVGINGLEFMQPTNASAKQVRVTGGGRNNDVGSYSRTINTGGSANMLDSFVPKTRAIRFTVAQPCDINIYAYSASTDANIDLKLSRDGKLVDSFQLMHSSLKLYKSYLDSAGTYYIYSTQGTAAICEVKVGYVRGDLDCDFDVDWNDVRLGRKAVLNNDFKDEMLKDKFDLDNNGYVSVNDLSILSGLVTEIDRAEFIKNMCWNANDMIVGNPECYEGLELVYKDCDIASKSIGVREIDKTYTGLNESKKVFTKCISTDGEAAKGKLNYPLTKAVKLNLVGNSYVTIYMSTGSSKNVQHKAQITNADNVVVAEVDLTKEIGKYTMELNGNETYFISSNTGTLRIYEIDVRDKLNKSASKTINVTANKELKLYLTVDNGVLLDSREVRLSYNPNAVTLEKMGGSSANKIGTCSDGTRITGIGQGYITFIPYNWTDGTSGIMTDIVLKPKSSGATTITLEM